MTIIKYNGDNPFTECLATPLISLNSNYQYANSNLHRVKSYTLRGKMKGDPCLGDSTQLFVKQQNLISKFSKNFKTLEVIENGNTIISESNCVVRNISFDDSSYSYILVFNIEIDVYDIGYASSGVINPSDEVSISNLENGTQQINRTISCSSINLSGVFLDNAINFLKSSPTHHLIPSNAILISRNERINRFTGDCSITEQYLYDPKNLQGLSNKGVIVYSTSIDDSDGKRTVSVNGEITGGLNATIENLRDSFSFINWYSVCVSEYNATFSDGDLDNSPEQFSITEDKTRTALSFSIQYSNIANKDAYIVDSTTISSDLRNGITCMSIELQFRCDYGCKSERLNKVIALKNSTDIDSFVAAKWAKYGTGPAPQSFKSSSLSQNDFEPSISIQRSYCNDNKYDCDCLKNFDFTLNFTPPINKYSSAIPIDGDGCHYTQNLNFKNRFRFSISGKYITSRCCSQEEAQQQLSSRVNFITSLYFPAIDKIIEEKSIDETENGVTGFSFTFSGLMDFSLPPISSGLLLDTEGNYILLKSGWRIKLS